MEIGSPPMYSEINRVARDKDLTFLKEFGPFLRVLSQVTLNTESNKPEKERITNGMSFGGATWNLAGSFMLWRGSPMKNEWIIPYM